jgi:uncharacterized phage protein (TIGR01671 family)
VRKILYRGKRLDNGEWVAGHYLTRRTNDGLHHTISVQDMWGFHDVHEESVGGYTGLHDKNGKEIYEGDIIKSIRGHIAAVEWDDDNGRFLAFTASRRIMYVGQDPAAEVIGDIYEHQHLLKDGVTHA